MPWDEPAIQQNRPVAAPPPKPPAQAGLFPPIQARTELPKAPPPPKRPAQTGTVVEHPKYGTGTIVRREGDGDDAKVLVSFPAPWDEEISGEIRRTEESLISNDEYKERRNTEERKKLKRAARKKAAPKAKRAAGVARGSQKKKDQQMVKGQTRKR